MQRRAPYGRVWCRLRMRHCASTAPLRHSAATAPQVAALTDSSGGPGGKFSAAQIRYFDRVDINGEGETAIFVTLKIFTCVPPLTNMRYGTTVLVWPNQMWTDDHCKLSPAADC